MFASLFRADASGDRSVFGNFWFSDVGARTGSGVRVTAASALGHPAVWACVNVLAKSFAVMPFALYQPKVGGGRTRNTNHWLYRLFAKAPNRFQTPFEWRLMLQGHLALRGNAFCQISATSAGEIIELLPLHPDRMKAELLDNGSYRYVYTDQTGKSIYFRRDEIWHLRSLSSDGILGLSLIEAEREAIGEGLAMQSYSSRFFANDAKPGGGWIEYPGSFSDKATKQTFRDSWQELQGGKNRGKVAVLERGMKFHELGMSNDDAQFAESRAGKTSEIARMFGVPPHKIGDLSKATFSNIEQQSIEFWTDTMLPWAEMWESSIEYFLLGEDTTLEPEFDMSRMMRGDAAARSTYYNTGINAGWLTRNEAREAEGFNPIEGLDEPLRPLNMVKNSQAPEEVAKPVAPNGDAAKPDDSAPNARLIEREVVDDALLSRGIDRIQSLAQAASRRVARKEALMVVGFEGSAKTPAEMHDAWMKHVSFVAQALGVAHGNAHKYCNGQSLAYEGGLIPASEWEEFAYPKLLRLALKGVL